MTAIAPFTLYAVKVSCVAQAASPVYIDQIRDQRISPGVQQLIEAADGQVDPTYVAVASAMPMISFTTTDLAAGLDLSALDGMKVDSDGDDPGVVCYLQAYAEGGTRGGDGTNISLTVANGILVPRQLQAQQGQAATIAYDLLPTSSDGSTAPIVIATAQDLPGTPSVEVLHTLGTVKINNADVPASDLTVDFGIQEIRESADGHVYPTYSSIAARQPSISFTTPNAAILNTLGLVGAARSAATTVYFRKMAKGSTRVAVGTTEHVSIAVNEGRIFVEDLAMAGNRYAARVTITPTWDGTNDIFVLDTTAAIA